MKLFKWAAYAIAALLAAGIAAPYITADQFGHRLQASLQRTLGRRVDMGRVTFSLFHGPGFLVEKVVIHEDPSIGIEPIAYVENMVVRPALFSLLAGRFVIASIRLDDASINLTKSGPASQWGRWNFAALVNPGVMRNVPAIQVRNGRINFKFGDDKSVFYLTETDLDISPPVSIGRGWKIDCSAKPARTDRAAFGLGSFTLAGRWYVAPERVDLNLELDQTGIGELTALMRGQAGGLHGTISSRLHLAGPIDRIGIVGQLTIADVHRWDLLPPKGRGWPLDIRGQLNLIGQQLELSSNSARDVPLPLSVRFRASDYLSQPHWAVGLNWNQFPAGPLLQLARDMGVQFPPDVQLAGTIDGAIGYSGQGSFQGSLAFHDTAVTIPNSPAVRFEQAYIVMDHGHVRLSPAVVRTADQDEARIEADYAMDSDTLDLTISTDAMKVASLHAQVSLAAVPWLEQVQTGEWSGELHYHHEPLKAGWTGDLELTGAQIPIAGLADPLELNSAHARIDGARVALDRMDGRAGNAAFTGEYSYEPDALRPHHVRLEADTLDAADLEAELLPTLRRPGGLIARALGRSTVPDWLRQRAVDGTVRIGDLQLAGEHLEDFRGLLIWDVTHAEIDGIQAKLDRAAVTGSLAVNLRGRRPSYTVTAKLNGLDWQSGKLDARGTLETSGLGLQLLTNMKSAGEFSGSALDFGTLASWRCVSGTFSLAWKQAAPALRVSELNLRSGDETYTGQGATQDDGRMVILLANGTKEVRVSGSLAKLRAEEMP